ncbi:MAG: hemerythrin domain-containing protein [Thiohalomonadaceae bacterium]
MFNFFKKKAQLKPDTATTTQYGMAPGTEIRYHPELINELMADHKSMLTLQEQIKTTFARQDYASVTVKLTDFQGYLHDHLLKENVRLYAYLEACFLNDHAKHELIRRFRREMDGIAKTALNFLKKYSTMAGNPALNATFTKDFDDVWQLFETRLQREELILYPLYMPPP